MRVEVGVGQYLSEVLVVIHLFWQLQKYLMPPQHKCNLHFNLKIFYLILQTNRQHTQPNILFCMNT